MAFQEEEEQKIILIGLSGASCSGKTTLARLLRTIFPSTFILHEDDFYYPDAQIPVRKGVQDWDCLESIDLLSLQNCMEFIRANGVSPPDLVSKEDQNEVGKSEADEGFMEGWKRSVERIGLGKKVVSIAIVDGFLLYSEKMKEVWRLFDVRLFLRADYHIVKERREARSGYVTLEGFWQDPPGYVDEIVWPNYVQDHAFLFIDGNVEGELDAEVCKRMKLNVMPLEGANDMTKCLDWACRIVQKAIEIHGHA